MSALLLLFVPDGGAMDRAGFRLEFRRQETLEKKWEFKGAFGIPKVKFFIAPAGDSTNGNVLVVESNQASGVLLRRLPERIWEKYPIIRWRWRLVKPISLPAGKPEPDDQAGVLYFGDGSMLRQRCVGYRWEVDAPVNSEELLKYCAGTMTVRKICVRNSSTAPGKWITEERDAVADYRRAFGTDPKSLCILSVGANSQYSRSNTRMEIDYIEFLPRKPVLKPGSGKTPPKK